MFAMPKAADLNELVEVGQLYWAFPFSKVSLVPDMCHYFYLVKNLKIAKNSTTAEAKEKIITHFESLEILLSSFH